MGGRGAGVPSYHHSRAMVPVKLLLSLGFLLLNLIDTSPLFSLLGLSLVVPFQSSVPWWPSVYPLAVSCPLATLFPWVHFSGCLDIYFMVDRMRYQQRTWAQYSDHSLPPSPSSANCLPNVVDMIQGRKRERRKKHDCSWIWWRRKCIVDIRESTARSRDIKASLE